jgi:uncharacterized membrane protein YeaQ/YmgE (transglycosylase-associated protein family)
MMPEVNSLIVWIILGGLSGWIASKIMGRDSQMGIFLNIVVGVIGAFIGGWLVGILGLGPATGLNIWSFIVSILGAVVLLFLVGLVARR